MKPEDWLIETGQRWSELCNEALAETGFDVCIDHRTLLEQQAEAVANSDLVGAATLERGPQEHRGPAAHGYEQRTGEKSRRREFIEVRATEYAVVADARADKKAGLLKDLAATERELKMLEHSARFIERSIPMEPSPAPVAMATGQFPAVKPAKPSIPEIVDVVAAMPASDRLVIVERARDIQPRAAVPAPVHASLLHILINKLRAVFGLKQAKEKFDGRPDGRNRFAQLAVERATAAASGRPAAGAAGLDTGRSVVLGSGIVGGTLDAGAGGNRRAGSSHDESSYQRSKLPVDRLPTLEVACSTCPLATWFSSGNTMKAHCGKLFLIVWNSDGQIPIEHCSTRDEALLQRQ